MSDVALRQLQRQAAQGDPEARVALLRERMRSEKLARDAVELAAWCRCEVAQQVLRCRPCGGTGKMPPPPPVCLVCLGKGWAGEPGGLSYQDKPESFAAWFQGLDRWGREVPVRAAMTAARVALPAWEDEHANPEDPDDRHWPPETCCVAPRRAIEACACWLEDPSEANLAAWEQASKHINGDWPTVDVLLGRLEWSLRVIGAAVNLTNKTEVRKAICEALVKWALK